MATISFLYRSTKKNAPLTARLLFRHEKKDYVYATKTQCYVDKDYWENSHFKKRKDAETKNKQLKISNELQSIENFILKAFNNAEIDEVDKNWLSRQLDYYYNPLIEKNLKEDVIFWFDEIIDNAHLRPNGKGGIGLGDCRINAYKRLKKLFKEFQGRKQYKVKELDKRVFNNFKKWLIEKNSYSIQYATKKTSDLKSVCKEANGNGIEMSKDFNSIKIKQVGTYEDDMDVIYLTEKELDKIENAELDNQSLINARKWLLIACYTGQRGETLINRVRPEFFEYNNGTVTINIVQRKVNKPVVIPILPKVQEINKNGYPYKVSTQNLNKHFKKIGEIAGLDNLVMGRIQEDKRGVKKLRPKYQYLSTHIGRKTFAMMHYKKLPTPVIKKVTGHSKEETFLKYVNKSDDSHINTFFEYYKTIEKKEEKSNLRIIKSASNQ